MKKILLALILILLLSACGNTDIGELTLKEGRDTVEINTEWIDEGALYEDESLSVTVYSDDDVDETTVGIYTIIYTFEKDEETYLITRFVVVQDQIAPELTLNPGTDTVVVGEDWVDAGVLVEDNSGDTITYTQEGTVNTNIVGVYEVIYSASDDSGNTSSITRYVNVIE